MIIEELQKLKTLPVGILNIWHQKNEADRWAITASLANDEHFSTVTTNKEDGLEGAMTRCWEMLEARRAEAVEVELLIEDLQKYGPWQVSYRNIDGKDQWGSYFNSDGEDIVEDSLVAVLRRLLEKLLKGNP